MTLTKIADMAGTSVSTVSKAFAGSHEISEETKEHIFEIARSLGCFDKYYKAPRKNPLIALMIPEIDSECYGVYASIFEREFRKMGVDTIVACTRFDKERELSLFRELAYGMRVDGILLWGTGKLIKNPDEIPLIIFDDATPESNADSVGMDLYAAIHKLVSTIKE
ncbi:MAG: LacI family DNA-binding transcriptional regulator, partial [Clostridia bacterium]|nr:LacI family DNA-binding transcriptional regulator [Clostridia bacterium]